MRVAHRRPLLLALAAVLVALPLTVTQPASAAAAIPAGFSDTQVAAVGSPTDVAFTPDGRMLVTTQGGQLRVVKNGTLLPTPALDLSSQVCTNSERGLLGVAADPDPATEAIYVFYTAKGPTGSCATANGTPAAADGPRNRVSKFLLDGDVADPASETRLLDGIYSTAGNHNAGDLHVGRDGYLYVSTGDGGCDYNGSAAPNGSGCGGANDASRDRNILNGKILRITTSGGIPPSNPFIGAGTARCRFAPAASGTVCQETYAWGLRNPFRLAFDPNASGTSFRINDVGQNVWEEIDQGAAGADYGWNVREGHCQQTGSTACGTAKPASMTDPVYDYSHSTAVGGTNCGSITGGAYVPTGAWPAAYAGRYLFSDYVCGAIFALSPSNTRTTLVSGLGSSSAVAMTFGPDGAGQSLYYTTYAGGGEVRRLRYTGTGNRVPVAAVTADPAYGALPLTTTLDATGSSDADGDTLRYAWNFGDGTSCATGCSASPKHTYTTTGSRTVTVTVTDPAGASATASTVLHPGDTPPRVTISAPSAGQTFTVGGVYALQGSATDAEDGPIPATALRWTVLKHHASHTHPFLGPVTGSSTSLTAPPPEDLAAAANSYLEVLLTATDSAGVSTTVSRRFDPTKVPVTVATTPTGRKVAINGQTFSAGSTVTSWAGYELALSIPKQYDATGREFGFQKWSDGGARSHAYVTPAAAATVTATLAPGPASLSGISVRQSDSSSAVISWSPPSDPGGSALAGYAVYRSGTDSAGQAAYSATVGATSRSFTMTKLVPGQTYTLSVVPFNAYAAGPRATALVTVIGASQSDPPRAVTVRADAPGTATISWLPPTNTGGKTITGYRVSRDSVDALGVGDYATTVAADVRSATLGRLVAGRIYHLSVQAVTSSGHGAVVRGTVVAHASTAANGSPSAYTVVQDSATTATVTWAPPVYTGGKTITGYQVSREGKDSAGGVAYNTTVGPAVRTFQLTRLVPGEVYTLRVAAATATVSPAIAATVVIR